MTRSSKRSMKPHVRENVASVNEFLRTVINTTIRQVGRTGGDGVMFPVLSQAEVADLMMAAVIVEGNGKFINDYS
ncbi:hypothetical protein [Delftia sp. JD2]|uniref:hypothetical protein n=1 Tax=Delftia sp. JD2 TaxID=469553 RepID=UPI00111217C4|nr:hypothetical protein [Delftia sp. JD2]